jgi:anti-anti-sigma regulatory factor
VDPESARDLPPPVEVDLRVLSAPRGRLATDQAFALRDAGLQIAAAGEGLRIECSDLEDIGGACLQVLIALAIELEKKGARVHLANLAPVVRRTLAQAGAEDRFVCG